LIRGHWISFYYLFISFWVIDTPTTANDYTRNRILHVCDLFTLGFLTVHIICMANQLFRRVLRSFTCAGFFRQTFRVLSWIPGTIWVFCFFFSPGTGNSYKMRRSLICDANVFSMRRESGDREKSRWYIAILQHFSVVFQLEKKIVCGEEEVVCVKPCKADWGRIIENPSLRPFPGFKRPVCLFFFTKFVG
jgi:hypothetical protein